MTLWLERHQVSLYLLALGMAAVVGLLAPATAPVWEGAIMPLLGALLTVAFLAVPFATIRESLKDVRFLRASLLLNFVVVPIVVFGLTRFIAGEQALLVGVLLVLLTPCVDYVIVFTRLAGGASDRLLASSPLLMLLQILFLPIMLSLFLGSDPASAIDPAPFIEAFLLLILLPLGIAVLTQVLAPRIVAVRRVETGMNRAMVPLMMATLFVVVASQIDGVRSELPQLLGVLPLFVSFLVIMPVLGLVSGRMLRLDVPATRALIFSGATRNSLVVLPLALALPSHLALAAVVVVTQTLVELLGMVVYVRVIPRLVRSA